MKVKNFTHQLRLNLLNTDFVFKQIFFPLLLLAVYSGSYALVSHLFMTSGVNYDFTFRLFKFTIPFLVLLGIYIISLKVINNKIYPEISSRLNIKDRDCLLLLIPLTPIAQYIIINKDILSWGNIFSIFAIFISLSAIYIFAFPTIVKRISPLKITIPLGIAFIYLITSMASLSKTYLWFEEGSLKVELAIFAILFFISFFFLASGNIKMLGILALVIFIGNTSFQLLFKNNVNTGSYPLDSSIESSSLYTLVDGKEPILKPNVYLLVYDSYVPSETMASYGIDNTSQERYLLAQGFTLYPDVYSVAADTLNSMSMVFNASTNLYGHLRKGVSGDGVVHHVFNRIGYKTLGIFSSDYMFLGFPSSYDFSFPGFLETGSGSQTWMSFVEAILMGEFRFTQLLNDVSRSDYLAMKHQALSDSYAEPIFLYTHSDLPGHSQNSGACIPQDIPDFKLDLTDANHEMVNDIETIIKNSPNSIIIIAGDHGSYLTKNCTSTTGFYNKEEINRQDIQDRYGTFLAIRWPTDDYKHFDDITVLQDLFPVIFSYMYRDEDILYTKPNPEILQSPNAISGVTVVNGIIKGGINDGEPLFLNEK